MYVIVDMEWAVNNIHHTSPTQIAAIRVDAKWNTESSFSSLIRPQDESFHNFAGVEYNGASKSDFISAPNAHKVFTSFQEWLNKDDILCWWRNTACNIFKNITNLVLKVDDAHQHIFLRDYIMGFLSDGKAVRGNPYVLATARNIPVPSLEHFSKNDAVAIQNLLKGVSFPQWNLLLPPKPMVETTKSSLKPATRYVYDTDQKLLHSCGCSLIPDGANLIGYKLLEIPLRKQYKTCSCMTEEFRLAKKERLLDEISRTDYNYIYTETSNVFHRPNCHLALTAWHILGSVKYDTAVATGRKPCKVCCPTPDQASKSIHPSKLGQKKTTPVPKYVTDRRLLSVVGAHNLLPKEEMNAISRLQAARKARGAGFSEMKLSKQERKDLMTISQPGLAFFVAKGYQTFHLRSCNKLQGKSELRGFDTFEKAIHAGYTPCRLCRPTRKDDASVSIPFDNQLRPNETTSVLDEYCTSAGYEHRESTDGSCYYITTPVGKWIIYPKTRPIHVDHINLIVTPNNTTMYHQQPRMFLSLLDTYRYIKRHDDTLIEKRANGIDVSTIDDDADDFLKANDN